MKVAILLAAYNSQRYIDEQICSILEQSYKDWVLYVRDDGSTDNTPNIIDSYSKQYPNKIRLIKDENKGLGAYHNFLHLLYCVDAEYYFFSDHDDVWLPNKIELSVNKMIKAVEKYSNDIPLLVFSDMKVVDESLNIINESFWKYSKLLPKHVKFEELVFCNSVNGCTIMINNKVKELSKANIAYCSMHDMLTAQTVAANRGVLLRIDEPTVLYRQHSNNAIGASNVDKKYIWGKLIQPFNRFRVFLNITKSKNHILKVPFYRYVFYKMEVVILRFFRVF